MLATVFTSFGVSTQRLDAATMLLQPQASPLPSPSPSPSSGLPVTALPIKKHMPLPVLNIGLPLSASTSVVDFFECGGVKHATMRLTASHYQCQLADGSNTYCAECIKGNLEGGRPPLQECGDYDVFAQMDGPWVKGEECFLPQVTHLSAMHKAYPNATFVLPLMAPGKWVQAVTDWYPEGRLRKRFAKCGLPECDEECVNDDTRFAEFYEHHTKAIRWFVAKHPGHKLVAFDVEGLKAGERLANETGFDATCWGETHCQKSCDFWQGLSKKRSVPVADRSAGKHAAASHEPASHEPATHPPAAHAPAEHESRARDKAMHEPATHEPATHEPATHEPTTAWEAMRVMVAHEEAGH